MVQWYIGTLQTFAHSLWLSTFFTFNILNKTEINERNTCFASLFFVPLHHIQDVMRVWAAAQQISSKLGSAFALHHTCIVNEGQNLRSS